MIPSLRCINLTDEVATDLRELVLAYEQMDDDCKKRLIGMAQSLAVTNESEKKNDFEIR